MKLSKLVLTFAVAAGTLTAHAQNTTMDSFWLNQQWDQFSTPDTAPAGIVPFLNGSFGYAGRSHDPNGVGKMVLRGINKLGGPLFNWDWVGTTPGSTTQAVGIDLTQQNMVLAARTASGALSLDKVHYSGTQAWHTEVPNADWIEIRKVWFDSKGHVLVLQDGPYVDQVICFSSATGALQWTHSFDQKTRVLVDSVASSPYGDVVVHGAHYKPDRYEFVVTLDPNSGNAKLLRERPDPTNHFDSLLTTDSIGNPVVLVHGDGDGGSRLTKFSRTDLSVSWDQILPSEYVFTKVNYDALNGFTIAGIHTTVAGSAISLARYSSNGVLQWQADKSDTAQPETLADFTQDQYGEIYVLSSMPGGYAKVSKFGVNGLNRWTRPYSDIPLKAHSIAVNKATGAVVSLNKNEATQEIFIRGITQTPAAVTDTFSTKSSGFTNTAALTANDRYASGLFAVKLTDPTHGTLSSYGNYGTFTYVPNANFHGQDRFTYRITRTGLPSSTGTVIINVL